MVSFNDPHLPMAKRPVTKLAHTCTGIFGSSATGECSGVKTACAWMEANKKELKALKNVPIEINK